MPRSVSQIDRSEMPLDAWRKAIDEKVTELDQEIAALVGGEEMRNQDALRRVNEALNGAIRIISQKQTDGGQKLDKLLEKAEAAEAERARRSARDKRWAWTQWLKLFGILASVVIASIYAFAHLTEPPRAEAPSQKEK